MDKILEARNFEFRTPVLAVAVGIYLPLELTVPIFVGGLIAWWAGRMVAERARKNDEDVEKAKTKSERKGLLFSSGLITGEALIGIILAIPFAVQESTDALRLVPESFAPYADWLGAIAAVFFIIWLYRVAIKK